jgi:hypothetical protein
MEEDKNADNVTVRLVPAFSGCFAKRKSGYGGAHPLFRLNYPLKVIGLSSDSPPYL